MVSGSGATDGTVNGRGNIIIGYNEDIFPFLGGSLPASKITGSHNLIVGKGANNSSFDAIVAGLDNVSDAEYASISGGNRNQATGNFSSISGGQRNEASGPRSSIIGIENNLASVEYSSVSDGSNYAAAGLRSTVGGGFGRSVVGEFDWRAGSLFETQ
ncbi:MAG: hypothetical protein G3M70_01825 [Candidatus Nitronauta litoralis]|uniref:Trimeric autotransporter adhesin YadA-like head domain-containing protein n=1 Tax=Candidatus Nitronauta litoralis TaxID=2705533 RepID=A0A7T0BTF9_9BACT|nr:MAG: hypothetical protein G3M70_01825 [Candidatus Nitronauta litoralis]